MFDNCLTSIIKLIAGRQKLTTAIMKTTTTTVRNFLRNYKNLASKNQILIIERHGKAEGVFMPYSEWEEKSPTDKISAKDLLKGLTFKSKNKNLSLEIDDILYKNFKK